MEKPRIITLLITDLLSSLGSPSRASWDYTFGVFSALSRFCVREGLQLKG